MNKILKISLGAASVVACGLLVSGCKDTKSYAELLTDEMHAVNVFLANHNVVLDIPADGELITLSDDPNAPYYRLDEDGNVYMQVVNIGDKNKMAEDNQLIYFRYTRYNLNNYDAATGDFSDSEGNAEEPGKVGAASFRYGNYSQTTSSEWGAGLQMPLAYVGMGAEVNLVIKSQLGRTDQISWVIPYLYEVTYRLSGNSDYDDSDEQ